MCRERKQKNFKGNFFTTTYKHILYMYCMTAAPSYCGGCDVSSGGFRFPFETNEKAHFSVHNA